MKEPWVAKWIGFDDTAVSVLVSGKGRQVEVGIGDPFEVALNSEAPAMAILPGADGKALVITIRRHAAAPPSDVEQIGIGSLGLRDTAL
jgi:hypothetical protein